VLQPGYRIGNYEVVRGLGAGGQGVVYLARHVTLDRLDAVKVLQPHLAGDPQAQQRFEREAVGAARLHHPNIAGVHDAGRAPDGSWYVAMQYVDGPSLDRLIPTHGLSLQRTAHLIAGVADALDAAHAHGLLHRDVKPGNIMVAHAATATEHPYLVDFGIAKLIDSTREPRTLGHVMGTYAYLAPERIEGRGDPRSDQYSLACTAFHCLTGTVPFPVTGEAAAIKAHLSIPPPAARGRRGDLPPAVDAVLARVMAKNPAARYPTCAAFASALVSAASVHNGANVGRSGSVAPTLVAPAQPVAPPIYPAAARARTSWLPSKAARLRAWDTGRHPQTWLGLLVAASVAFIASIPLQRIVTGQTEVPVDLSVQFAAIMLLTLVSGALGTWLLMRRNAGAWFMLLLSALAVPALRATLALTGTASGGSLDTALQWVAFQPLESGYSAYTVHNGDVSLSSHGLVLTGICVAMAAAYVFGWWIWSTGLAHIGRTPKREWPWLGGVSAVVFVTVLAFGDLPADVGALIAFALALNLVAAYSLARKYIEGWLLFLAAQVCQLSYALSVSDHHVRPPSMKADGLVPASTLLSTNMGLYYWLTLILGAIGLCTWIVDLRRAGSGQPAGRWPVPPR
jgi:nicotinamide riboside transporter PnuC